MLEDIRNIKINPENPRKISSANRKKLMISILLFPKMLNKRWIITNKDNIALAGNQRVTVLKSILDLKEQDLKSTLEQSPLYIGLSEEEKDSVIKYWSEWRSNPVVDIEKPDLSKDEEKELIIKDNVSFGDYDFLKLKGLFDSKTLIEMGFDESDFYNPADDENVKVNLEGSRPIKTDILRFGEYQCPMTRSEFDRLEALYQKHIEEVGTSFGFITKLKNYAVNKN